MNQPEELSQVAFKGESDAQCLWMREDFCQYIYIHSSHTNHMSMWGKKMGSKYIVQEWIMVFFGTE